MIGDKYFQACFECDSINVATRELTDEDPEITVITYACRDCGECWEDEFYDAKSSSQS